MTTERKARHPSSAIGSFYRNLIYSYGNIISALVSKHGVDAMGAG